MRATVSAAFPAVNGLITLTARAGQRSPLTAAVAIMSTATAVPRHSMRIDMNWLSLSCRRSLRRVSTLAMRCLVSGNPLDRLNDRKYSTRREAEKSRAPRAPRVVNNGREAAHGGGLSRTSRLDESALI